jgi:hypothetical protein
MNNIQIILYWVTCIILFIFLNTQFSFLNYFFVPVPIPEHLKIHDIHDMNYIGNIEYKFDLLKPIYIFINYVSKYVS